MAAFNISFLLLVFSNLVVVSFAVVFVSVRECGRLGLIELLESLGLSFSSNMKYFSCITSNHFSVTPSHPSLTWNSSYTYLSLLGIIPQISEPLFSFFGFWFCLFGLFLFVLYFG